MRGSILIGGGGHDPVTQAVINDQKKLEETLKLFQEKLKHAASACHYMALLLDQHNISKPEYMAKMKRIFSGEEAFEAKEDE